MWCDTTVIHDNTPRRADSSGTEVDCWVDPAMRRHRNYSIVHEVNNLFLCFYCEFRALYFNSRLHKVHRPVQTQMVVRSRAPWWLLGARVAALVEGLVPISKQPEIGDSNGADNHGGIK